MMYRMVMTDLRYHARISMEIDVANDALMKKIIERFERMLDFEIVSWTPKI
jgi:hypothetical protein